MTCSFRPFGNLMHGFALSMYGQLEALSIRLVDSLGFR
jgi:hypothetical protein